ncbi:orotate phosphoribosyltransferase [Nitrospira sp. KM1]|uniref:orotate phosphoribosyltransferase n=1 Tax=Nitrospira sp. KM1 TaxID=1936990 RepID=UPI0013A7582D|nr:phosphoribosyltransferase family protein [Nitrospira sp. KM1]BCA54516.1 orotate phosphoribosyltransferase [Nitrospira sp. KM1]
MSAPSLLCAGSLGFGLGKSHHSTFDKYQFEADPKLLRRIAKEMIILLPPESQVLAGLELGGVPIATAMSLETGMPVVFVRKKAKDYGTCQAVEGGTIRGKRVVLIEDVITTGGAVVDAARLVREAGAEIIAVACAIWRGQGAARIDALPDIPVFAAMTKADLTRGDNS